MRQKHLKKIVAWVLAGCFLLCGCERESAYDDQRLLKKNNDITQSEMVAKTYRVNSRKLNITPDSLRQNQFHLQGQMLYFQDMTGSEVDIYCQSLVEESYTQRLPLNFEKSDHLLYFFIDETESVYCFVKTEGDEYYFKGYSKEGNLLAEQEITQFIPSEQDVFFVEKAVIDSKGIIYVSSASAVWLFLENGQYLGQVEIPAQSILDIGISREGKAYVTYYYGDSIQVTLAEIDSQACTLGKKLSIPGNGKLFTGLEQGVLTYNSNYLYEVSTDTGKQKILLDWVIHSIDSSSICLLWGESDREIGVITQNDDLSATNDKCVEFLTLKEVAFAQSDPISSQEKTTLYLISPGASEDPDLLRFIVDFNKQSDQYIISYEAIEFGDMEELSSFTNTRLVSQDSPDLILINYSFYETYADARVLEDLSPYLEKSNFLSVEDYLDTVIEPFQSESSVYGIPKSFSVKALAGRKSQVDNIHRKGSWPFSFLNAQKESQKGINIDDFLSYLEKNPDAKFEWDGDPSGILRFCLKYSINSFVDFDNGICNFEGEDFRNIMLRINDLERTHATGIGEWNALKKEDEKLIPEITLFDFYTLSGAEIEYGDEMMLLGYPTADGSMKCEICPDNTIGILANSNNKEGAWEFLEYYLLNYDCSSGFPSSRKEFEEVLNTAQTKQYTKDENGKKTEIPVSQYFFEWQLVPIYALSEKQANHILTAVENAKPISKEANVIIEIVYEEAQAYFYGHKTLEETLRIIQSRAQLYLSENR